MAHIWTLTGNDNGECWQASPLADAGCALTFSSGAGLQFGPPARAADCDPSSIFILPAGPNGTRRRWVLLAGRNADTRINGSFLPLRIRTLSDRDEIIFAGRHRLFFSTEELARVTAFPGLAQPAFCPRCKQKLEPGELAVACPQCGAWHHESEKFPCWTYGPVCALCQAQATALDAGYSWTPECL